MRFIEWDDEIVNNTYNEFKPLQKTEDDRTTWGNVAESLVQKHYNQPIHHVLNKPDNGWDMEIEGIKIDIKCQKAKLCYFNSPNSWFIVNAYKPLKADYYLFCQIDPDTKNIALIGYLTKQDIVVQCRKYKKGDTICTKLNADCDCYIVDRAYLHEIN